MIFKTYFHRGFLLCFLLSILVGSCKHGCTFSSIVKTKSKTENIGDRKLKISAKLIKSRNVKYRWRTGVLQRSKAYYSVELDASIDSFYLHLDWYFPAEKGQDLKPFLDNTNLKVSNNKKYIVMQYKEEKELDCLFQILDNKTVITSPYSEDFFQNKYSLNTLPDDKKLKTDLIEKLDFYKKVERHQDLLFSWFNGLNLIESECIQLLEHLKSPTNNLASNYFSEKRIIALGEKFPKFRKAALDMSIESIKNSGIPGYRIRDMFRLIENLAGQAEFDRVDLIVSDIWGDSFSEFDDYIRFRLENKKFPMKSNVKKQLEYRSIQSINSLSEKKTNYKKRLVKGYVDPEKAAQFMIWTKNNRYVEKYALAVYKDGKDLRDLDKLADKYYPYLSSGLKQKIVESAKRHFETNLKKDEQINTAEAYNVLQKGLTCVELKKYYIRYKTQFSSDAFIHQEPDC